MGALDGIRVVDFTRFQQGPWGTAMLADMGAEVIKIEARLSGDLGRALGQQPDGFCAYFEAHNRGKKSVTLDLTRPAACDVVRRLVARSDVLVQNFRPGVMERLGLSYEAMKEVNPLLVYASASGFGPKGPYGDRPSFDIIGQGMGGVMVAQGGGPGHDPRAVVPGIADQVGGMTLAYAIAVALLARERQGIGQQIDTSLYGAQISMQAFQLTSAWRSGVQGSRTESATFTAYPGSDGRWFSVAYLDPYVFPRLCRAAGRDDLVADPRFAEPFARAENNEALLAELRATFLTAPREHWFQRLIENDVPCGPVQDYLDVGEDRQALANGYVTTVDHPSLGQLRVVGPPAAFSATPGRVGIAPELGQHTEEVLQELGYNWDEIESLRDQAVI